MIQSVRSQGGKNPYHEIKQIVFDQGQVPRKVVKFEPGLRQISSKVFLSKNKLLELTKYFCAFTSRFSDDNTKCYSKKSIGR